MVDLSSSQTVKLPEGTLNGFGSDCLIFESLAPLFTSKMQKADRPVPRSLGRSWRLGDLGARGGIWSHKNGYNLAIW